ncbi:DUF1656 domain-containing protein [Vibrio lentus]
MGVKMKDQLLFGNVYVPSFMILVIVSLFALMLVKYFLGNVLRKNKIMNPSLCELCLVIIVAGQFLLLQVK